MGVEWFNFPINFSTRLRYSFELKKRIDGIVSNYDFVSLNSPWNAFSWQVYTSCVQNNVKYIYSLRGSFFPWSLSNGRFQKFVSWHFFQRKMMENANYLHVTSDEELACLERLGIKNKSTINLPNPVSQVFYDEELSKNEARQLLNIPKETRVLLFFSRINRKKGLEYILRALKNHSSSNVKLLIAGQVDDEYYFKSIGTLIAQLNLENIVDFIGHIQSSDKRLYFKASDLFVLTSHTENFGMSIAEALSNNLPVLVSNNTPWQNVNNRAGWCVNLTQEKVDIALSEFFEMSSTKLARFALDAPKFVKPFSPDVIATKFIQSIK